jgi:hypothetical protein
MEDLSVHPARISARSVSTHRKTIQRELSPGQPEVKLVVVLCWGTCADCSRFDPGTLSILERLDRLEVLLRSQRRPEIEQHLPTDDLRVEQHNDEHGQFQPPNPESPILGTTVDTFPYNVTVEGVLSWSVFHPDFEDHVDLKTLLRGGYDSDAVSPRRTLSIVDFEVVDGSRLIRNYFDNVHVFNPVLDENKIQGYMRDARFRGLGWDAQSCLLVRL